jgi:GH25 family lysozyme M1 (1,4-beta-N-acetylmuramidase)
LTRRKMSIADPVFGVDVHPEYQKGFDFDRAKAQGYEYAFIKASEGPYWDGTTYVPTGFKEYYNRAKASGLIVGLYHFLVESDPRDPQRGGRIQAEHFLRTIDSVGGTNGKLICVDFEHYSDSHPWLTPGNATLKSFISSLRMLIGKHPIILYSGRDFWNGGDTSGPFDQYGAGLPTEWHFGLGVAGGDRLAGGRGGLAWAVRFRRATLARATD